MMKNILLLISVMGFSSTVFAEAAPRPPLLTDLINGKTCGAYATQMARYLETTHLSNDSYNSLWFELYADVRSLTAAQESCKDDICTISYSGGAMPISGCTIAEVASDNHKALLLSKLTESYNQAIEHKYISPKDGHFAFTGRPGVCTPNNKYQDCQLETRSHHSH